MLAEAVDQVFQSRGWKTYDAAEEETGVSRSSIRRMHKGIKVKPETVIDFAKRIGEDTSKWAKLSVGVEDTPLANGTAGNSTGLSLPPHDGEITVKSGDVIRLWGAVPGKQVVVTPEVRAWLELAAELQEKGRKGGGISIKELGAEYDSENPVTDGSD